VCTQFEYFSRTHTFIDSTFMVNECRDEESGGEKLLTQFTSSFYALFRSTRIVNHAKRGAGRARSVKNAILATK
jgi:hypothetical protein